MKEYYILTACGLRKCDGEQYDKDYAIVYNWKNNTYSITHIETGLSVIERKSKEEIMKYIEDYVENANKYIFENKRKIDNAKKQFNSFKKYKVYAD